MIRERLLLACCFFFSSCYTTPEPQSPAGPPSLPFIPGQRRPPSYPIDSCPGYTASNVQDRGSTLTADLKLAGTACNTYGRDLTELKLRVEYQTGKQEPLALLFLALGRCQFAFDSCAVPKLSFLVVYSSGAVIGSEMA
ncbi:hypothetical protein IWZ00DRAFT_211443 [Phyllosticta capitalensis]